MRDDLLPESDQNQIMEMLLLQDAQAGQAEAVHELIKRYAPAVHQLSAYLLPGQERIFEAVQDVFASFLFKSAGEIMEESLDLLLAQTTLHVCQIVWDASTFENTLMETLRSITPSARAAWLLVNTSIISETRIASILSVTDEYLAGMLISVTKQLEAAGIGQAEIDQFFQERQIIPSWDTEDTNRLVDVLTNQLLEEKRRQRIRVLTLEIVWLVLGVAILVFGFQIFSSIGVQPGGGTAGFEPQTTETILPEGTPVPDVTAGPTRTPLPYETTQANGRSFAPAVSADGRTIVFTSEATNLVADDTNEQADVFLYDRVTRNLSLVSIGMEAAPANGTSAGASVSGDGSVVVFVSWALNLAPGIENSCMTETGNQRPCAQVYLLDREIGEIQLVSQQGAVAGDGDSGVNPSSVNPGEFTAVSEDGNVVAFYSRAENLGADSVFGGLFLSIRDTGELIRVDRAYDQSPVNGPSYWPSLSSDGRFLAFTTQASNLVDDDLNNQADIYIYDRDLDTLVRITTGPAGTGANGASVLPSLSADGRWLAFRSEADDLVEGDFNHTADVFLHDLRNGITALVSSTNQAVSADRASNLPAVSGDGEYVGFVSLATDFAAGSFNGTWDLYLYAQDTRQPELVSRGPEDQPANGPSSWPNLSADGRIVVFVSAADNLVENDVNGIEDIFLLQRESGLISRINVPNSVGK